MLQINSTRFLNDIQALAKIGRTADGGVTRCAFSEADVAGRNWLKERIIADRFIYREDGAGNQSALLPSTQHEQAKTLLSGSHIDTVTNGGRFDGAFGVLAALEALRTIREANIDTSVHLEAIAFTDEEGSILGGIGSMALAGLLTPEKLAAPRGGIEKLNEGMARLGITPLTVAAAQRNREELQGFVEIHIEQGTRLEEAQEDIGVVTAIVGIRSAWLTFNGEAAHAGTKPMAQRADALWGASAFIQRAKALIMEKYTPGVMNCGKIEAQPGAFNIIPATVKMALEFRHGSEALLDAMQEDLFALAQAVAAENRLTVEINPTLTLKAAPMSEQVVQAIEQAAATLQLKHRRMLSFAGHDSQIMTRVCPTAMIFAPSVDGISHNPREYTKDEDLINGANTLLNTLVALATS